MRIDKNLCMSHFLAFRFIKDVNVNFYHGLTHSVFNQLDEKDIKRILAAKSDDKTSVIKTCLEAILKEK